MCSVVIYPLSYSHRPIIRGHATLSSYAAVTFCVLALCTESDAGEEFSVLVRPCSGPEELTMSGQDVNSPHAMSLTPNPLLLVCTDFPMAGHLLGFQRGRRWVPQTCGWTFLQNIYQKVERTASIKTEEIQIMLGEPMCLSEKNRSNKLVLLYSGEKMMI